MITPNPVLKKLGLSEGDRAVILHADYETLRDLDLRTAVRAAARAAGVHIIGYRALRELMPGRGGL